MLKSCGGLAALSYTQFKLNVKQDAPVFRPDTQIELKMKQDAHVVLSVIQFALN